MNSSFPTIDRLCLVPGPWQLIMLEAALREQESEGNPRQDDTLVLFESWGTEKVRMWMDKMAQAIRPWKKIVWGTALFNPSFPQDRWPWPVEQFTSAIKQALNVTCPTQLWMGHLEGLPYRLAMETYPRVPVSVYEDGFLSPVSVWHMGLKYWLRKPHHLLAHWWRGSLLDHIRSDRLSTWLLPDAYVRRVAGLHTFVGSKVPLPNPYHRLARHDIRDETLRAVLGDMARVLRIKELVPSEQMFGKKDVLFLAQPLESMMQDDRPYRPELELELYRSVLNPLVKESYRVWWKDHPRQNGSVFGELKGEYGASLQRLPFVDQLPIELFFTVHKFDHCIGMTSSSLFYLPRLFGTKVYTFADKVVPLVSERRAEYLALGAACRWLPSIHELLSVQEKD